MIDVKGWISFKLLRESWGKRKGKGKKWNGDSKQGDEGRDGRRMRRIKVDEVFEDKWNGILEPSRESFEDGWRVPRKFDLRQTDIQSIRWDIVICLCVTLNQGCGLLPTPSDLGCWRVLEEDESCPGIDPWLALGGIPKWLGGLS